MRLVKDSGIEPSKIMKRLNRQLSRRSDKFMNARPSHWDKMRLWRKILEDFTGKLKTLSSENQDQINNKEQSGAEKAASLNEPAKVETTCSVSETILNIAGQDFHFEIEYSVADDN
jgi:hypothetical protein